MGKTTEAALVLKDVKNAARNKYAWPGGYPLHVITSDGGCLCAGCVKAEFRLIADSVIRGIDDGWRAIGADINWEQEISCDHCGNAIESAYGDDDGEID